MIIRRPGFRQPGPPERCGRPDLQFAHHHRGDLDEPGHFATRNFHLCDGGVLVEPLNAGNTPAHQLGGAERRHDNEFEGVGPDRALNHGHLLSWNLQ